MAYFSFFYLYAHTGSSNAYTDTEDTVYYFDVDAKFLEVRKGVGGREKGKEGGYLVLFQTCIPTDTRRFHIHFQRVGRLGPIFRVLQEPAFHRDVCSDEGGGREGRRKARGKSCSNDNYPHIYTALLPVSLTPLRVRTRRICRMTVSALINWRRAGRTLCIHFRRYQRRKAGREEGREGGESHCIDIRRQLLTNLLFLSLPPQFGTGNLQTLLYGPQSKGQDVRAALFDFHEKVCSRASSLPPSLPHSLSRIKYLFQLL